MRFLWNTYRVHGTDQNFVEVIGHGPFVGRTISLSKGRYIMSWVLVIGALAAGAILNAMFWGATGAPFFAFLSVICLLLSGGASWFLAWALTAATGQRKPA